MRSVPALGWPVGRVDGWMGGWVGEWAGRHGRWLKSRVGRVGSLAAPTHAPLRNLRKHTHTHTPRGTRGAPFSPFSPFSPLPVSR